MRNDMSERDSFLAAICEVPECDTRRLAFADWLEERDEPGRAEFIRLQCEIARLRRIGNPQCTSGSARWCPVCGDCTCANPEDGLSDPGCPLHDPDNSPHAELEHATYLGYRERELFKSEWLPSFNGELREWRFDDASLDGEGNPFRFRVLRGFACEVWLPAADFLEHAAAIFSQHPVTSVRLTDKEPYNLGSTTWAYAWFREGVQVETASNLPQAIFNELTASHKEYGGKMHQTSEDAHNALSAACVAYGRSLATLRRAA